MEKVMTTTTLSNASGNPYIDGLTLEPGQLTPVIFTPGTLVTFFFDTDQRAWSDLEKEAVTAAWESWDRLIDLNIEETNDRSAATVLMQISNLSDGTLAQASAPVDGAIQSTNQTSAKEEDQALEFINFGGDSYLTLMHEIGHNLGIYHPHTATTFPGVSANEEQDMGDFNMNQNIWTVMSYVVGYDQEPVTGKVFGAAMTPMTLDIAAAQFAYGAAQSNTGDDTYTIITQNAVGTGWTAIWDTGGTDTISAEGATGATNIDLRAATLEGSTPGGHVSWMGGIQGGYTIANGVVIENVIGGNGIDTVTGNQANNTFIGDGGDDFFTGGSGDDFFTGGSGDDTSIMNSSAASVTVTFDKSGSISVTDRNGTEGKDTLISVEKLTFADRTLDLDNYSSLTQLNDAQFSDLAKVYVAYFNRAADAEGLYFWADKLAEGMDMATIASYFSQSAEAKALYPDTANTSAFVTAVYANVLGRTPDQAGFDFWTTNLNNGAMQPASFVLSIIGGAQGADITYLSNKADLGVYFSTIKGMSDGVDAQNVLNIFGDQSTSNKSDAKTAVDGHYADAMASGGGEFIFNVVGIVSDPFADFA
jgi:hypothetical protein